MKVVRGQEGRNMPRYFHPFLVQRETKLTADTAAAAERKTGGDLGRKLNRTLPRLFANLVRFSTVPVHLNKACVSNLKLHLRPKDPRYEAKRERRNIILISLVLFS
jgi:hypothetical protein